MITVSAQYGDVKACNAVRPIHKALNNLLEPFDLSEMVEGIDQIGIVLRVDGDIWQYQGEGPERLRILKSKNRAEVDVIIPQSKWRDLSQDQLRDYMHQLMLKTFQVIFQKMHNKKMLRITQQQAMDQIEKALGVNARSSEEI